MVSKNCMIGQSGGPTAVINASVIGVIKKATESSDINKIYGTRHGVEGLLENNIIDLTIMSSEQAELLKNTPSSILGSCRYKLKETEYEKVFEIFKKYEIGYFYYIGGNDSMDTVDKLSKYAESINSGIKIIGIPKTIDNDLPITDHCPGYGSAAKFIATSVMEIARDGDVYDKENIHIIEVMGRHAGWLAASSTLAKNDIIDAPDLIYLPEIVFDIEEFLNKVKSLLKSKDRLNIVVAEGIKDKNGVYIYESGESRHDKFGHKQMGGVGVFLGNVLQKEVIDRVKVVELNVLQRAAAHCASKLDIDEAYQCGQNAVVFSLEGNTGIMVGIKRINNSPYQAKSIMIPVENVANKEKMVPLNWIDIENKSMKEAFIEYVSPLIMGEVKLPLKNGLPNFSNFYNK